ncbi:HNH endonuclease signature motif containing protein [Aspergillus neoniger CBS 115656]|uniref:Uncharacterized protein n=1 Tax=Aspergillus neoniger (strain CBS 115656) TaxID=1448310 RepID=A0A318YXN3_ASPNB|nr:hypothetical protein BO87DRAFT_411664 [Aspergillus neoniger CBS 115656]PYH39685.1 hypothetical protein BO87DRAFT_411664 [Aspergillus neoniger CBS 115656]
MQSLSQAFINENATSNTGSSILESNIYASRHQTACVNLTEELSSEAKKRNAQDGDSCRDDDGNLLSSGLQGGFQYLEVAHIIPHNLAMAQEESELSEARMNVFRILDMFDPGLSHLLDGPNIDRPFNALTLTNHYHRLFVEFQIYFEPTGRPHEYKIDSSETSFLRDPLFPVTRTPSLSPNGRIEPPDARLLRVHCAIAHILKLSGAGDYIEKVLRDLEEVDIKADGSTNLGFMMGLRLNGQAVENDDTRSISPIFSGPTFCSHLSTIIRTVGTRNVAQPSTVMAILVEDVTKVPFYNFHDPIPSPPPPSLTRKLPTFKTTLPSLYSSTVLLEYPEQAAVPAPTELPPPPPPKANLFLTLPPELRLLIYTHLLTNHHHHHHHRRTLSAANNIANNRPQLSTQNQIHLYNPHHNKTNNLHPSILLTCKQIHAEALPILYTQITFSTTHPTHLHHHLTSIGPLNTSLLRSLHIFVPWSNSSSTIWSWIVLLHNLSEHATGLRYLEIGWDTNIPWLTHMEPGDEARGLGDNILFVHALARLRQLRRLRIYGFFGVEWPGYLRRELGAGGTVVEVECGLVRSVMMEGRDEVGSGRGPLEKEENLKAFGLFQRGTVGVVP